MLRSVDIVEQTKPDIIDINFGCPVKKVVCKGAGAGILKDIDKISMGQFKWDRLLYLINQKNHYIKK